MALEMELKYLDANQEELRRRMQETGGFSSGPYFEMNLVFDTPDRSLKAAGTLLRLRRKKGDAVLTVKKQLDAVVDSSLKVVEELESGVEDFQSVKLALEALGFGVAFAYEKVRDKWLFMECAVCLDHLPFGLFVEIEGAEDAVFSCAEALGLKDSKTTKSTYHALNRQYRLENGLPVDENFLFADEEKARILRELGKD